MTVQLNQWLGSTNDKLKELGFSDTEIIQAMNETETTLERITTTEDYELEPSFYNVKELVRDYHNGTVKRTMVYKGKQWETYETARVQTYRVIAQYARYGKLIENLLLKKFPFLKDFEITVYDLESGHHDVFVKNENKSDLMVSVLELNNKDVQSVKQKNHKYYDDFYHNCIAGKAGEHVDQYYLVNETDTAKRFYKELEQ